MERKNVILITMDEVRPDHLSCYGYKRIKTPNIDFFANEGIRFETAVSTSCFTPLSHATILTGVYPNRHNLRDPFCGLEWKMISETFQENGYRTAGFVGVNLLGEANYFNAGFQHYDEPKHEEIWKRCPFPDDDRGEVLWGNWWIPRMLKWLKDHADEPFFVWTHYFDVHQSAEKILLEIGKIREGVMPEYGYYDPKIQYMDTAYFGPLREALEDLGIHEKTTILITSDHGTNLEEHEVPPFPHLDLVYPQHTTMYDCDLLVPLILRDRDLPKDVAIGGMVRTVDIAPTLVDLTGLDSNVRFDGVSLIPFIEKGRAEGLIAYAEEMYEKRGPGDFQAIRNDRYKYVVDWRNGTEEFYDLATDPSEKSNLVSNLTKEQKQLAKDWRALCDNYRERKETGFVMDRGDRDRIKDRLRKLGYIR